MRGQKVRERKLNLRMFLFIGNIGFGELFVLALIIAGLVSLIRALLRRSSK